MCLKNKFIFGIMFLFLIGIAIAEDTTLGVYRQGDCVELKQICASCSYVNFTRISYPNSSVAVSNIEADKNGVSFSYDFCNTSELGIYIVEGIGDVDGTDTIFVYDFEVTYSGLKITEGKAILYISFFILLILLFIINFIGMGYLPKRNVRDEEGKLMSISYLKYFRDVLWVTGWMLLIAIFYLASNIAFAFMEEQMFAKTLFMIFQVAFALTPIIIIVWLIWIFASMFHDVQFQKMLNRGIFPGGNL